MKGQRRNSGIFPAIRVRSVRFHSAPWLLAIAFAFDCSLAMPTASATERTSCPPATESSEPSAAPASRSFSGVSGGAPQTPTAAVGPTWNPATHTLRNQYFSVKLEPSHGGRIVSLTNRLVDLTVPASAEDLARPRVPYHFGLLSVQLWQDSYWHNDLCHRPWALRKAVGTPSQVSVSLEGTSSLWRGVSVRRTVTLGNDPWIDVEHELHPGEPSKAYLPPTFWFSNVMPGRGRTFVPGPTGSADRPGST